MAKTRIAVIFGGVSSEHDVSLLSATSVINTLDEQKYDVVKIGITKSGRWLFFPGESSLIADGRWENDPDCVPVVVSPDRTHKGLIKLLRDGSFTVLKIDVIFPVLHGKNGEDGTVQGLFELAGIPYVGCDLISSANCMDKAVTKTLLSSFNIPNTQWELYDGSISFEDFANKCESSLDYPVFVKPANAGSSVGINKAYDREQLADAINIAKAHDRKILIEKCIDAREIECAVLGNNKPIASELGEVIPHSDFYDYEAKYLSSTSELSYPANVTLEQRETIREMAVRAYSSLGCAGLSRVDFFIDKNDGSILLNEINTLPGFTAISMYPKLFDISGIPYSQLLDELIKYAMERADG